MEDNRLDQVLMFGHNDGKGTNESGEFYCRIHLSEEQRSMIQWALRQHQPNHNQVDLFTTGEDVEDARMKMGRVLRGFSEVFQEAIHEWRKAKFYYTGNQLTDGLNEKHFDEVEESKKKEITLKLTDEQIKQIRRMGIEVNL